MLRNVFTEKKTRLNLHFSKSTVVICSQSTFYVKIAKVTVEYISDLLKYQR